MTRDQKYKEVFGSATLPMMFPELRDIAHQEAILATIFDALCWQIRLVLLDPHSIHRIGKAWFYREDFQYRVVARPEQSDAPTLMCAIISLHSINVNRRSYGELHESIRAQLPDKGVMPPPSLFMVKEMVIEGDEPLVRMLYARFCAFPAMAHGQHELLAMLKQSVRERLINQSHAHFALQDSVAKYYGVDGS